MTIMLAYGGLSANFIVIPTLIFKMFGLKAGGQLYSVLYVTRALAQVIMMWVIMAVAANFSGAQQYNIMFFSGSAMIAVAGGLLLFLREE